MQYATKAVNPCYKARLAENNQREVQLSNNEVNEFLTKAYEIDERLFNAMYIKLYTGMRQGEILELTRDEVDFINNRITLSRLKTKSKKMRIIPLATGLSEFLSKLKNNSSSDKVLTNCTQEVLKKKWKKLLDSISFNTINDGTHLRFHDLRHIYAQKMLDNGTPIEDVSTLLGHQDIATKQRRYAQFARPDLQEKAQAMDNVISFKKKKNDSTQVNIASTEEDGKEAISQ